MGNLYHTSHRFKDHRQWSGTKILRATGEEDNYKDTFYIQQSIKEASETLIEIKKLITE